MSISWQRGRRLQRYPLRAGRRRERRHRQDHDQPPRGPQRLPARDGDRALGRVRARPRGPVGRRGDPDRRGPATRSARAATSACAAAAAATSPAPIRPRPAPTRRVGRFHVTDLHVQIRRHAEAGRGDGRRLRGRRRPRAARRLRPDDRRRQRPLRPDRPEGRLVRRRLRRERPLPAGRAQEGQGDLVPVPPVRRPAGARHGPGQHGRAARPSSRTRPSSGAARCSRCRRSRCGC